MLRHRKYKYIAQRLTASKCKSWDLNPGTLTPKNELLITLYIALVLLNASQIKVADQKIEMVIYDDWFEKCA